MSRRIWTGIATSHLGLNEQQAGRAASDEAPQATRREDFLGRLLKYIPAEVVGLYLAVRGVIPSPKTGEVDEVTLLWIITAACWALVPIYLWVATSRDGQKPLLIQILLATIAFPVWVFAIAGPPVSSVPWLNSHQYVASVVLIFTTFVFGLVAPPQGV
jgi:hypothetical protein